MNTISKADRQHQLRKVAILVATLDDPLAERLLANLPAREAVTVRRIVEHLEDIDPAEHRAIVEDFRAGITAPQQPQAELQQTQLDGVELDASLLARMAAGESSEVMPVSAQSTNPWKALSNADAATLVEMLSAEQPQTIAVVLSRLETSRAAELITKLSPILQTEVLERLAELDPADEQTLEVVASQLAEWITAQRQQRQRMAAGRELVHRILQDTPDSQRHVLLARLGKQNPALAERLSTESSLSPLMVRPPSRPPPATYQAPRRTTVAPTEDSTNTSIESKDPLSELEELDDQALLRALRQADRQTVMLALAGAGESLMKRIVRGLPRRQANQFRQQVRSIGPTRLGDMLAAQRELVRFGKA